MTKGKAKSGDHQPGAPGQAETTKPTIWEQWLNRLNSSPEPSLDIEQNRFELLEFLTRNLTTSDQFYARLGTILSRSITATAVIVYEQGKEKNKTLFSSIPQSQERHIFSHEHLTGQLKKLKAPFASQRTKLIKIQINKVVKNINVITRIDLTINNNKETVMLIFSENNLSELDHRFAYLVSAMIGVRRKQQHLSDALTSENERLSTLTHHLSEGLMILDTNLNVQLWNRPLQRLTNYTARDAEGKIYSNSLMRVGYPHWLSDLRQEYENNPTRNVFYADFQLHTKQKEKRWVSISGSFLRDSKGSINQTVVIIRDISRTKELETRKNDFISIATHELRTPITAIKGYLSMLERASDGLTDKQCHYLARATEANNRLVELAEELLQVIQVEENRLQFSIQPTEALPIVRKVITDFTSKAQKKGLVLVVLSPKWPTTIAVDPVRFEQIIANLVDNAVKYTEKGRVEVSFSEPTEQRFLPIHVRDTGIGLTEREIQLVFDKFHRTSAAHVGRETGAGLGLFIVKSFIEKQGGKITVRSRLNRGSTFTVMLPIIEKL